MSVFLTVSYFEIPSLKANNSSVGVTEREIVIGSSSALSGHASFLGIQYNHGALAWFNEVNSKGGVNGRKIRLIALDDAYDPPKTVDNTNELIEKSFLLFNYIGTPTSVKIIKTVNDNKIPAFGFLTGAETLRTPFRKYMFHIRASYYAEVEGAIKYFVDKLGLSKVAVFYQNDAFGYAVLRGIQLALQSRNMEIVAVDTYIRGTMDIERAVNSIKDSGAEAVIMVGTYSPLAKFIDESTRLNFNPYFHTVSFVGSKAFGREIVKRDVNPRHYKKILVTQVVPSPYDDKLESVKLYHHTLKKYYPNDEPNYVSLEGFINARILVMALEKTGEKLTRKSFINTVESIDKFKTGIGKEISFAKTDHTGLEAIFYSYLNKDGIFVTFNN